MSIVKVKNQKDLKVLENACICFGVFDGIHKGHKFEIEHCIKDAHNNNLKSACLTFDMDPDELFVKDFYKLMSNSQRINNLAKFPLDNVLVLDFIKIKDLSPQNFLDFVFGDNIPNSIHVGQGFRFGAGASGNEQLLKSWGADHNMKIHVHELLTENDQVISSSNIRKKLLSYKFLTANC